MTKGIGGHHRAYRGKTDSWITPPEVLKALGEFDLDPCAAPNQPWPCAKESFDVIDDGLLQPWKGRVFLNSPYGPETVKWLAKLALHGNGLALTFARTDTSWFHSEIFEKADGILFLRGRLTFWYENGKKAKANSGGPSVLVAYGSNNVQCLKTCGLPGQYVDLSLRSQ